MTSRRSTLRILLPALVAIPLLVACSSSNKNNNTSNTSNNAPASAAATTAASATAVATPASVSTAAAGGAAATAASTAAASAGSSAAATTSAGSTLATAAAAAEGTPTDKALQAQLQSAILQASDLPSGYTQEATDDTVDTSSGMTAGYNATYTSLGSGSSGVDIEAIVDALAGFKDANTAQANFKDIQSQITQGAGEDINLTPLTNTPTVGDQTVAFKVAGSESGVNIAGYAIIWRHGKLAAAIVQVGAPGPQTVDQTVALAQAQDKKLAAIH